MRAALVLLVACSGGASTPEADPSVSPKAAAGSGKPIVAKAKPKKIVSDLPEKGPHPDYPTPVAAGTDKLFVIEEPDRGAVAPLDFPMPAAAGLHWTTHAHCELSPTTVTCVPDQPAAGAVRWRVGRDAKTVVVERWRGAVADAKYVFVMANGETRQKVTFDAFGNVESALLFATSARYSMRLRSGANGLAGCGAMELSLDKEWRPTAMKCLQWSGDPMHDTSGVAVRKYKRDPRGLIIEEARFGTTGAPVTASDGVHRVKYELDALGRAVAERFHGSDGGLVANNRGCFGYRSERDAHGLVIARRCLDSDDRPTTDSRGASATLTIYDRNGCVTATRYEGASPKDRGFETVVDDHCAVQRKSCLDSKGKPVACSVGEPARYEYQRDGAGNALVTRNYDAAGQAVVDPTWHAFEVRRVFDRRGLATSYACFDVAGTAIECRGLGFHREEVEYDGAGREITRRFFDPAGVVTRNLGSTVMHFTYDNYDHQFEGRSYDGDGKLVESLGMAVRRDLYDIAHRRFAVILLDKDGKPATYTGCYSSATCPKAWHAVRLVRLADGTVDKNQFFDAAGQLIDTKDCTKIRCFR